MNIREYIIATIQNSRMDGCEDLVDVMIRRIQDIAVSLFQNDHPHPNTIRYVLTYCPYIEKDDIYVAQYEGTDEDYQRAKEYVDAALRIFFDAFILSGKEDGVDNRKSVELTKQVVDVTVGFQAAADGFKKGSQ